MRSALVTGATGFIGGHVVRALAADGWKVHVLVRPTSDTRKLAASAAVTIHVMGRALPDAVFADGPFDAVLLLAASYGRDAESPSTTLAANVQFPLELLDRAISERVPAVIHADTCFTPEYNYLRPYTLSKKQFAQWGRILVQGTGTRFVNLILQHPYGPGDRPEKFVPGMIRRNLDSDGTIDLTPGGQRKDFVYVSDVARAFTAILDNLDHLPAGYSDLECGTGLAVSIREFVEAIHRLTDSRATLRFGALDYRENEIMHSEADPTALRALGWTPRVSLDDGLRTILREDFGRG